MSDRVSIPRRDALRISAAAGLGIAFGGGLVAEWLRLRRLHRIEVTRPRLGTLVTLQVVHPDPDEGRRWVDSAFDEIDRLESLLSRHRPDTPVARLNRLGSLDAPPGELVTVLEYAQDVSRRTEGAFDVTVAPVLAEYVDAAARGAVPEERRVEQARSLVGFERLRIGAGRIAFSVPGMALTLDGVGKGFVVDRTVERLVTLGAERVLVDAGGDVASGGRGSALDPWRIGLQTPPSPGSAPPPARGRIHLSGGAVATSGDYLQAFTEDRSAHHVIDPRTGRSPLAVSSATVVAPTAMEADALSTACMVMDPDAAFDLLAALPGVEGRIISKTGEGRESSDFGRGPVFPANHAQ